MMNASKFFPCLAFHSFDKIGRSFIEEILNFGKSKLHTANTAELKTIAYLIGAVEYFIPDEQLMCLAFETGQNTQVFIHKAIAQ